MRIVLNADEMALLHEHDPETAGSGGFQSLMTHLQSIVDADTGEMELDESDVERLSRSVNNYRSGGWQARLHAIFDRTLGPDLEGK